MYAHVWMCVPHAHPRWWLLCHWGEIERNRGGWFLSSAFLSFWAVTQITSNWKIIKENSHPPQHLGGSRGVKETVLLPLLPFVSIAPHRRYAIAPWVAAKDVRWVVCYFEEIDNLIQSFIVPFCTLLLLLGRRWWSW